MKEAESLRREIKRLTDLLEENLKGSRWMVYSTNPLKFIFYNFLAGVFHSLGSLVGTVMILALGGWLLSRVLGEVDLTGAISDWFRQVIEQASRDLPAGGR